MASPPHLAIQAPTLERHLAELDAALAMAPISDPPMVLPVDGPPLPPRTSSMHGAPAGVMLAPPNAPPPRRGSSYAAPYPPPARSPATAAVDSDATSPVGRRFMCDYPGCGRAFDRPYNLKTHQRTHTGEKPFPCDLCEKSFGRAHDLKRHKMTMHEHAKPFKCRRCDHRFVRHDALVRHVRSDATCDQFYAASGLDVGTQPPSPMPSPATGAAAAMSPGAYSPLTAAAGLSPGVSDAFGRLAIPTPTTQAANAASSAHQNEDVDMDMADEHGGLDSFSLDRAAGIDVPPAAEDAMSTSSASVALSDVAAGRATLERLFRAHGYTGSAVSLDRLLELNNMHDAASLGRDTLDRLVAQWRREHGHADGSSRSSGTLMSQETLDRLLGAATSSAESASGGAIPPPRHAGARGSLGHAPLDAVPVLPPHAATADLIMLPPLDPAGTLTSMHGSVADRFGTGSRSMRSSATLMSADTLDRLLQHDPGANGGGGGAVDGDEDSSVDPPIGAATLDRLLNADELVPSTPFGGGAAWASGGAPPPPRHSSSGAGARYSR
ncbi:hypothetical protein AMAG_03224 [Allomyces macrogynus ATCC 38327]|uniref:C2H2-type domain-containing protein n=1 Tax=Allomyces macrogynus (strain ATCC 38327) TaxID=578462 RepID=A0A0L0S537_ALLM3|nr:hypothetical protein AMAG_03224 [Allomyces macrogynus ATCC 38327]|eukprot:KNE57521.1 hypothetical protein AMAG_03224 [Allomyces macrogynus ATCC 38327]